MKEIQSKIHLMGIVLMFMLMIPFNLFAQQGAITGQVIDEKDEGIIGATVQIKGTSDGTTTDIDGNFSLNGKIGNTLVISYVGYSTQELKYPSFRETVSHLKKMLKFWKKQWLWDMEQQEKAT